MKQLLVYILFFGILFLLFGQCTKDKSLAVQPTIDCDTIAVSFSQDIVPIFQTKCASGLGGGTGCHDSWAADYEIISGKNEGGYIENRVLLLKDMPPIPNQYNIPPLTQEEEDLLNCWIYQDWPDN